MKGKVKFSIFTHWISCLGETKAKTFLGFNLIVISYAIFNLYFVNKIQWLFATNLQLTLFYIFFGAYSVFLISILLVPQNVNFKIHKRLSNFLFVSIISGLILLFLSLQGVLLAITLLVGILLSYSVILMFAKYKAIPMTLVKVRKEEKSFLIRNSCFLEWLFFFLVIANQILILVP